MKEPEIKLFGRKIVLPDKAAGDSSAQSTSGSGGGDAHHENQLHAQEEEEAEDCQTTMQEKNEDVEEEPRNPTAWSEMDDDPKTPPADEDATSENEETVAANGQQKAALKKPDKILPCPRCNSTDTKFCYYNNYNVKQPRHFCKSCQRYWTAGGTMRNVPVGAGRRKNKNSASHGLQAAGARVDVPGGFHHPAFGPNGTVLSFGPDTPLCESMASAMNLSDKRAPNVIGNAREDCSMRSSLAISNFVPEGGKNGPPQLVMPIPCIPGVAWPVPWNPGMPLPAICPPGYPMPVFPAPYWNCSAPNAWNVPWAPTTPPGTNQTANASGPNSPLGKHSRNGELLMPRNSPGLELAESKDPESSILVPKTLRIDDPEEAAKSSIWETLGIKYDSVSREGLFKALQPKGNEKKLMISASPTLQANPAALSRSICFQEGA